MSGRILVVDDIEPNVRLLKAKLEAEYYDVLTATRGAQAIEIAKEAVPDLILLDVMMPHMDGYEVCARLKDDPRTRHIPVILVTALDQQEDRVCGLEAGADDFLTKPIDDVTLMARVRSLLRLKMVMDELRSREANGRAMGAIFSQTPECIDIKGDMRILVLEDDEGQGQRIQQKLGAGYATTLCWEPREASALLQKNTFDLFIVNLAARGFDGLRLCARIRSDETGRLMPILALVDPGNRDRIVRALDLGVSDVLFRPVEANELAARVQTQIRRKRYADTLRKSLDDSFEMSVTDQLTGLNNRRFMDARLEDALVRFSRGVETTSVLMLDVDFFKAVNDQWGHDAGDRVLQEIARRIKANMRAIDVGCRYGGEEFVIVMPGATIEDARQAAERLRAAVEGSAFEIGQGKPPVKITISGGLAQLRDGDTAKRIMARADACLYAAKSAGRNCIKSDEKDSQAA